MMLTFFCPLRYLIAYRLVSILETTVVHRVLQSIETYPYPFHDRIEGEQ
jgi:hypothetical protein